MSTVMGNPTNNKLDINVYAKGDPGVGIESTTIEFQVGVSPTIVPTGTWSTSIVAPDPGEYLWTRTTFIYTNGITKISYNVSFFPNNGGWYVPSVAANGDLSWTPSESYLPSVETSNIKGPQGEPGSVKFLYVNSLPTEDIETDAFYIMNAEHPTQDKLYDEYYYINNHWEKIGSDLSNYYTKQEVEDLISDAFTQWLS